MSDDVDNGRPLLPVEDGAAETVFWADAVQLRQAWQRLPTYKRQVLVDFAHELRCVAKGVQSWRK